MFIQRRKITASDEVNVAPEATDLLFEAEDVAELVAEVTGEPVEVDAEESTVTFTVGEDQFTVEAEGDEEVLESVRRPLKNKRTVSATTRRPVGKRAPVKSSRTVKKVPRTRK
jgi:hypothetical protein